MGCSKIFLPPPFCFVLCSVLFSPDLALLIEGPELAFKSWLGLGGLSGLEPADHVHHMGDLKTFFLSPV